MPQSQPTANPRCQEKKDKNQYVQNFSFFYFILFIYLFFIFYFFQHIKMSKAFTLEKSQKKRKKKKSFLFMACTPVYFIVYGICGTIYSLFRTPTLPYRAQPLLYATGEMSLNRGLDCSSICSMHALVVNCLPSFGRAIG